MARPITKRYDAGHVVVTEGGGVVIVQSQLHGGVPFDAYQLEPDDAFDLGTVLIEHAQRAGQRRVDEESLRTRKRGHREQG